MEDLCDECECANSTSSKWSLALAGGAAAVLLFALSWDSLEPTQYGLVQNGFTGYVELDPQKVYEAGRHFVLLRHHFLKFPRNLVSLEFSNSYGGRADRSAIPARTGPDPDDRESGGQPVHLSVSFQYQLARKDVPRVYQTFGTAWEASYLRFAQQAITNEAQLFTPRTFWNDRASVEERLLHAVNASLSTQGYATVHSLQLLKVDFSKNYEDIITQIQLQEQLKVTKTYQLEVTRVLKEVDILQSSTSATVAQIEARAQRESSVLINEASARAIKTEQEAKAEWYSKLKQQLQWTNADFIKYVKIKSLGAQQAGMVVGVDAVE